MRREGRATGAPQLHDQGAAGALEFLDRDPEVAADQGFPITTCQPRYHVADSLDEARLRMQRHGETLARSFHACCKPLTETIRVDRAVQM